METRSEMEFSSPAFNKFERHKISKDSKYFHKLCGRFFPFYEKYLQSVYLVKAAL